MPRRPAKIERDIPLYLIAPVVKQEVSTYGESLERVIVRRTSSHFYICQYQVTAGKKGTVRESTLVTVHCAEKKAGKEEGK